MEKHVKHWGELITESRDSALAEFAQKRLKAAEDTASRAQDKGGAAVLTYHHFIVKLPYYRRAANGKFSITEAGQELSSLTSQLNRLLTDITPSDRVSFQKIMGKIEVIGELLIESTRL